MNKQYFLVHWNEECLRLRIIAGPFRKDEKRSILRSEVLALMMQRFGHDEIEAANRYDANDAWNDKDKNISVSEHGATLISEGGYEDRLQVVEYDVNPEMIMPTPGGNIKVRPLPDDEYPGIALLLDYPGEPGIIMEFNSDADCFKARVYSVERPDDEPSEIIKFKKEV